MQIIAIAVISVGMRGTRANRTLDGKCVTTIVDISPIFSANFAAKRALTPATILQTNTIEPNFVGFVPYVRENHS